MVNIGDLLSGYLKIKNPLTEKKEVCEVLNEKFKLGINESQIFFRKNTVILKISPVKRSFIYMNKDKILEEVKAVVPERFINIIQF